MNPPTSRRLARTSSSRTEKILPTHQIKKTASIPQKQPEPPSPWPCENREFEETKGGISEIDEKARRELEVVLAVQAEQQFELRQWIRAEPVPFASALAEQFDRFVDEIKPPLKKNYGAYGNGVRINPVLNVPSGSLFGLGSIFNGKEKSKRKMNQ
ncbi:hypothetical protein Acr_03g0015620 [Actinidia rufa]|uniref:Uncharacterized protein n=1 Tax=Actinidia rufa TaxID=165716 RepID=A0A7J0EE68_9ERIC|nr:hypothetical protein Acr_03g0015620 [Actinidia rufa]